MINMNTCDIFDGQFDRAKRGITIFGLYLSITAKVRAGNEETLSIRLVEIKRLCSVTAQKIRNVPQLYTTLLQFEDIEMGIVNLIWSPRCH